MLYANITKKILHTKKYPYNGPLRNFWVQKYDTEREAEISHEQKGYLEQEIGGGHKNALQFLYTRNENANKPNFCFLATEITRWVELA